MLHRDIKPPNILYFEETDQCKLCDFGVARQYEVPRQLFSPEIGTLRYTAPEVNLGLRSYTAAIDMFALGLVFIELVTGAQVFPKVTCHLEELFRLFELMGTPDFTKFADLPEYCFLSDKFPRFKRRAVESFWPQLSPLGYNLVIRMLEINPEKRIIPKDALKHEYFQEFLPKEELKGELITGKTFKNFLN